VPASAIDGSTPTSPRRWRSIKPRSSHGAVGLDAIAKLDPRGGMFEEKCLQHIRDPDGDGSRDDGEHQELEQYGLSAADARAAARREMGNVTRAREDSRGCSSRSAFPCSAACCARWRRRCG
jgi:hypothetical protein